MEQGLHQVQLTCPSEHTSLTEKHMHGAALGRQHRCETKRITSGCSSEQPGKLGGEGRESESTTGSRCKKRLVERTRKASNPRNEDGCASVFICERHRGRQSSRAIYEDLECPELDPEDSHRRRGYTPTFLAGVTILELKDDVSACWLAVECIPNEAQVADSRATRAAENVLKIVKGQMRQ